MAILAQHDSTYEVRFSQLLTHSLSKTLNNLDILQVEGLDPAVNTDGETLDH